MRVFIAGLVFAVSCSFICQGTYLHPEEGRALRAVLSSTRSSAPREAEQVVPNLHQRRVINMQLESEEPAFRMSISYLLKKVIPEHLNYVSVNVSYNNIWEELATFPERRPRAFNLWLATFKTWSADLLVQFGTLKPEGPRCIDWRRSAAFAVFGCLYVGIVQWMLYITCFSWMFPNAMAFANEPLYSKINDRQGQYDLIRQVLTDNFLLQPFVYFPVFYSIKNFIQRVSACQHATAATADQSQAELLAGRTLSVYRQNFWKDNLCSVVIWIPGDFLIFSAPMYLRMPVDHSLSFLWTMVLSYLRGASPPKVIAAKSPEHCEGVVEKA